MRSGSWKAQRIIINASATPKVLILLALCDFAPVKKGGIAELAVVVRTVEVHFLALELVHLCITLIKLTRVLHLDCSGHHSILSSTLIPVINVHFL